jgi:hypothetical protein
MSYNISKQDFITAVDNIFNVTLPRVMSTKIDEKGGDFSLKVSDIAFKEREFQGEVLKWYIKNSKDNRRPSIKPNSKKLPRKLEYLLRVICRVSDINFIPVGVMHDSPCLEAEDRGHIATLFWCHRETRFELKLWRKVRGILDTFMSNKSLINPQLEEVWIRLNEMIDKKSDFSIVELIPQKIMENWMNSTIPVSVKVYPNRDKHIQEIISFNSTEDTWTTHQRALRMTAGFLRKSNIDSENLFDTIFTFVDGNDYFIGNDEHFLTQHSAMTAKAENAEEEILYLWLSASKSAPKKGQEEVDDLEVYKKFNTTDHLKRHKQYENLFRTGSYRHPKAWKSAFDFLNAVAESKAYLTYEATLHNICQPYASKNQSYTNLRDMTVKKVDTALMFCWVIWKYINSNKLNQTFINYEKVANKVFEEANKMLQDEAIVNDLHEAYSGHKGRYENFFSILIARMEPTEEFVGDVRGQLLLDARSKLRKTTINPDMPFTIIDRTGKGVGSFHVTEIDLTSGKGLDKGHKDPTGSGNDYDNFFLQFSGDNRSWSNNRHFDPVEYGKEYLSEVEKWLDRNNDDQYQAYLNTKKFIEYVW